MCGILGIVGKLPDKKIIKEARDVLSHRGPDGKGLYLKKDIALAHRRLSIIDLTKDGNQPFFSDDKRYVIVYNGEIYNYLELKKELSYDFKTKTDTEVLLASYITWGKDCLEKLNGMFAFAIWDSKEKKLFLARDRFGEKPLYYSFVGNSLYFASEIKALLKLGVSSAVNQEAIFDFLYYGFYDYGPQTFFKNIYQFPNASYGFWQDGKLEIRKYWELIETKNQTGFLSDKDIEEKFKNLLADSIRLRFRSDVPVGISLSSGLDSNSILHYAYEVTGKKDIPIFSGCMPSEEYNECSLIEQYLTPEQKKVWYTCEFKPEETFDLINEMIAIQDQPFAGINVACNMKFYSQAKKEGVTVLLEGQGGDELLAGYKYYLTEHQKDLAGEKIKDTISLLGYDATSQLDHQVLDQNFIRKHFKPFEIKNPTDSHLLNAQYRDITHLKLARIFRFNDHTSMYYSRELRLPYLDHRLVEFCFWLPVRFKIEGDRQKVLIRNAIGPYLPEIIKEKSKKAAGAIQVEWFRNYYQDKIMEILNSDSFKSREYWNREELIKKAERFFNGEGDNSFWLWQAIHLELWFRKIID